MSTITDFQHWTFARDVQIAGVTVRLWGGWCWKEGTTEYRTDEEGHGLWHRNENDTEWHPIIGQCQFYLPPDRGKALRKLRRKRG